MPTDGTSVAAGRLRLERCELSHPGEDPPGEQLGHSGVTEMILNVPPHREGNDLGQEAITRERGGTPGGEAAATAEALMDLSALAITPVLARRRKAAA